MSTYIASVIISTYNQPKWLQNVLWGYEFQSENNFEIIIADDGSTEETKVVVDAFISNSFLNIKHIWQEDDGFQKTKILNKAIIETSSNYLIFTDGDCIPRQDFVETHLKLQKESCFLSGGYFKLPENISNNISKENIKSLDTVMHLDWHVECDFEQVVSSNKRHYAEAAQNLAGHFLLLESFSSEDYNLWTNTNFLQRKEDSLAFKGRAKSLMKNVHKSVLRSLRASAFLKTADAEDIEGISIQSLV